jgi:hypothetical protein
MLRCQFEDTVEELEPSKEKTPYSINANGNQMRHNTVCKPTKTTLGNQESVSILGDSMAKRLDVRRIRQSVGNKKRVHIRTFSGACIEDMDHHAGTNNIPRDEPEDIASKTAKLSEYIERTSK